MLQLLACYWSALCQLIVACIAAMYYKCTGLVLITCQLYTRSAFAGYHSRAGYALVMQLQRTNSMAGVNYLCTCCIVLAWQLCIGYASVMSVVYTGCMRVMCWLFACYVLVVHQLCIHQALAMDWSHIAGTYSAQNYHMTNSSVTGSQCITSTQRMHN